MLRRLAFPALLVLAFACEDKRLATPAPTPKPPPVEEEKSDSGAPVVEGWGDPKTTRVEGMLRLAQLNVRRYFDATCDSDNCDETGFEEVPTPARFDARTAELAKALGALQADVVTLAEVENQGCLDALRMKLKEAGFEYPVAHVAETDTPGSVDVAVLARGKLDNVATHRKETPLTREDGSKTQFTRELPEVHLTFGSKRVIVFAAHFRSKSDDDPGRRLAEAKATHAIMLEVANANEDAIVLLGGDLNDVPGSPAIDELEEDGSLLRVAKDLPADEQGTYTFSGERQAIDHIFTASATAYVAKSAKVVRSGGSGFAGSDHAAIRADFELRR